MIVSKGVFLLFETKSSEGKKKGPVSAKLLDLIWEKNDIRSGKVEKKVSSLKRK